jgi:hypothetical protein
MLCSMISSRRPELWSQLNPVLIRDTFDFIDMHFHFSAKCGT